MHSPEGPQTIFRNLANPNLVSAAHGLVAFYGPFKHDDGFFSEGDSKVSHVTARRPLSRDPGFARRMSARATASFSFCF